MPYGDTGIHGLSLSVDGQNVPGYGSTVEYGASVAFNVWASLASDAPQAGNLILTVDVVDAEGNLHTRQSQKAANPGDGVQFNVGTFTANLAGSWTATVTLSADVPLGTYYTLVYYPFWDVSEGPPPAGVTFVAGESKELNVGLVPK